MCDEEVNIESKQACQGGKGEGGRPAANAFTRCPWKTRERAVPAPRLFLLPSVRGAEGALRS